MMLSQGRLKTALAISAAVNLFVFGAAAGVLIGLLYAAHAASSAPKPQPTLWAVAETLRPRDRTAFRDLLRDRARSLAPETRETREARHEAARVIAAPIYNPAAAQAALANVRAREVRVRGEIDATLLEFVARLDAPARSALADAVVRGRIGPAGKAPGGANPPTTPPRLNAGE